jgi:hypothetical protein
MDGFVIGPQRNIYAKWFGHIPREHIDPPLGGKIREMPTLLMNFLMWVDSLTSQ